MLRHLLALIALVLMTAAPMGVAAQDTLVPPEPDRSATGGAQTTRAEDHQRRDELDDVIEQDAPLVDPGRQLMQIPAQRARQGLGLVVVDQAGQVPPAGIAA